MACIAFTCSGNMRRCTTGIPTAQHALTKARRSTYCEELKIELRRSRGSRPKISRLFDSALVKSRPKDIANELKTCRSAADSVPRCLKRALSFQTNSTRSPRSGFGASPNFRANANRSSAWADGLSEASSLHHAGHAASIAAVLIPDLRSCFRSLVEEFSAKISSFSVRIELAVGPESLLPSVQVVS